MCWREEKGVDGWAIGKRKRIEGSVCVNEKEGVLVVVVVVVG